MEGWEKGKGSRHDKPRSDCSYFENIASCWECRFCTVSLQSLNLFWSSCTLFLASAGAILSFHHWGHLVFTLHIFFKPRLFLLPIIHIFIWVSLVIVPAFLNTFLVSIICILGTVQFDRYSLHNFLFLAILLHVESCSLQPEACRATRFYSWWLQVTCYHFEVQPFSAPGKIFPRQLRL